MTRYLLFGCRPILAIFQEPCRLAFRSWWSTFPPTWFCWCQNLQASVYPQGHCCSTVNFQAEDMDRVSTLMSLWTTFISWQYLIVSTKIRMYYLYLVQCTWLAILWRRSSDQQHRTTIHHSCTLVSTRCSHPPRRPRIYWRCWDDRVWLAFVFRSWQPRSLLSRVWLQIFGVYLCGWLVWRCSWLHLSERSVTAQDFIEVIVLIDTHHIIKPFSAGI